MAGGTIPNGSPELPYRLCNAEQLETVIDTPSLWDDHFVLGNNLDLTNVAGQIGTFSGTLEGLGYRLSNFGRGSAPAAGGLIALLTGSITNLVAHNFRVHATALELVGALVDDNAGSITNITLSAGVSSGAGFSPVLGGLVGLNRGSITGCHAEVALITPDACHVGGLVGHLSEGGSIIDSSATGTLEKLSANDCTSTASGGHAMGGLVGFGQGHIGSSFSNTSVLSAASHVGGLVGHLETPGDIQDSDARGPLTSGHDHTGGLTGSATGNFWNASATCEVEGAEATGGLVGSANGSNIFHSHASGSVTGEARTGGLGGKLTASTVEQSHASGDVTKTSGLYVGGLVGALEAGSSLIDSYAWGDVIGSGQDSGALIGYSVAGNTLTRVYATGAAERGGLVAIDDGNTSYTACYWHSDKHARAVGSLAEDPAGTFGRSEAELLLEAGYGGYDFVGVWMIEEGVGYAGLR